MNCCQCTYHTVFAIFSVEGKNLLIIIYGPEKATRRTLLIQKGPARLVDAMLTFTYIYAYVYKSTFKGYF